MVIKQFLMVLLISSLFACSGKNSRPSDSDRKDRESAKTNVQLASGYIRRGNLEIAKAKLFKAMEHDDDYVPAYTTMAVLMTMLGDIAEAEKYYQEALDIDGNDPDLHNNYGTFLCKHGKFDAAKEQFDIALRNQFYMTPEVAHANLGYCMMQAQRPDYAKAEKHLREALSINANMSSALLAMGELGLKTGKYLMSRAYMQRYHAQARPDSHSLWIQIQAEHALDDREYFLKLSRKLLKQFPQSDEARMVMELSNR